MRLVFTETAWQDYLWFLEKDRQLSKRINLLIKDTLRAPFEGLGKPEPLKAGTYRVIGHGELITNTAWFMARPQQTS